MLDFVAQHLVEPTWLAAHLHDEEVRVIDARWRGDGPGTVPAGAPARGGPPGLAARPELDGRARSGVPAPAARTLRGGHGSGGDRGPDARGRLCRNGPLRGCSALVGAALLRPRPGGRPQWRVDQVGGSLPDTFFLKEVTKRKYGEKTKPSVPQRSKRLW